MTASQFIDLVVVEGADDGMRYTIEINSYRVVGRRDPMPFATDQLTTFGDRALNADQQKLIDDGIAGVQSGMLARINRSPDVLLSDPAVSRMHAVVFYDDGNLYIADLMSTNGTRRNGHVVRKTKLEIKDVVRLGNSKLEVRLG